MADDARTEARRRIAEAIEDAPWPCPHGGIKSMDSADWFTCPECRADAVLALFDPGESWHVGGEDDEGAWVMAADDQDDARALAAKHGGTPVAVLRLAFALRGPVEPVTKEPTDAR